MNDSREKENTDMCDIQPDGVAPAGNYYGSLCITSHDGKFYWTVENYDGYDWLEIPKYIYLAIKRQCK